MSEFTSAMRMVNGGRFSTAIQRVDYPIQKGAPNPKHGMYFFVGSVPSACMADGRSRFYATESDAARAAFAAGCDRVQGEDCRWIERS